MKKKETILKHLSEIRTYFEENKTPDPIKEWNEDPNEELRIKATDTYIKIANSKIQENGSKQ